MTSPIRKIAAAAGIVLLCAASAIGGAWMSSGLQRGAVEGIVRDYLLSNPEILQEVSAELERKMQTAQSARFRDAVKENADAIFNSPHGVVAGNPSGDVTLVEFFDYNCPYCKRASVEIDALIASDPKLQVVFREFPVLGQGSVEAARVAVSVKMQDPKKYLAFREKMFGVTGQANFERALSVAQEVGADGARIQQDVNKEDVTRALVENKELAELKLGMTGTPSYVIGQDVVVGAMPLEQLKEKVAMARCGKPAC